MAADERPDGAYPFTEGGLVFLDVVIDGRTSRLRMGPTYAANLGMALLAGSSKAANHGVDELIGSVPKPQALSGGKR